MLSMLGLSSAVAFILMKLPTVIAVASDVSIFVSSLKAGESVYETIKSKWPEVTDAIDGLGKLLPNDPMISEIEHLEGIAKAMFADFSWSPEQLAALKPFMPENTGGGSIGYNQQADVGNS